MRYEKCDNVIYPQFKKPDIKPDILDLGNGWSMIEVDHTVFQNGKIEDILQRIFVESLIP